MLAGNIRTVKHLTSNGRSSFLIIGNEEHNGDCHHPLCAAALAPQTSSFSVYALRSRQSLRVQKQHLRLWLTPAPSTKPVSL